MVAIALVGVTAGAAQAGKPTKAKAKAVVTAWLAERDEHADPADDRKSVERLAAMTQLPLVAVVRDYEREGDGDPNCEGAMCSCTLNVTDAAALGAARGCLGHLHGGKLGHLSSKGVKAALQTFSEHKALLKKAAKTGRLLELTDEMCGREGGWTVFVVVQGKDKVARVAAALSVGGFCGE